MIDLSDYLEPDDEEPASGPDPDLVALKACLSALADAVASTNLAVLTSVKGDGAGAGLRVQASVAALKRFSEAFTILNDDPSAAGADDQD